MEDLERELKQALARKDAPAWFEQKVLAAAARESELRPVWWQRFALGARVRWASAVLAAGVVIASGTVWEHERVVRDREAGQAAKAKLELALKITRVKLTRIEQKLNDIERN